MKLVGVTGSFAYGLNDAMRAEATDRSSCYSSLLRGTFADRFLADGILESRWVTQVREANLGLFAYGLDDAWG